VLLYSFRNSISFCQNEGSQRSRFQEATWNAATPTAASNQTELHGSTRHFIENTIRKQWTAARKPPKPCSARRPGAALLLRQSSISIDPDADRPGPLTEADLDLSEFRTIRNRARAGPRSGRSSSVSISSIPLIWVVASSHACAHRERAHQESVRARALWMLLRVEKPSRIR
jgi:hypothetical protein